jgi:DNA-binding transcriptional LysR family regulator
MRQIDWNLLTALEALLTERHVTNAANKIGLSEPAMSRALGRLRLTFGDQLLVRVGREYYLTSFAEGLVEPVQDLTRHIQDTLSLRATFDPATDERQFSVATSDYAAFLILRPLVTQLPTEAPKIVIHAPSLAVDSLKRLGVGEFDLLLSGDGRESRLPRTLLFHDRWICAVGANNSDVGESITMDDYLRLPHISFARGPSVPHSGEVALAELGLSQRNSMMLESHFMLPFFLDSSPLLAVIPERIGKLLQQQVRIRLLDPPFDTPRIAIYMSWHPRSTNDPGHQWLRTRIEKIVAGFDDV